MFRMALEYYLDFSMDGSLNDDISGFSLSKWMQMNLRLF